MVVSQAPTPVQAQSVATNSRSLRHGLSRAVRSGLKSRAFLRHVTLTMGTEVVSLGSRLVLISVVGRWLGAAALAEYLLLTRVTAWLFAGSILGLGVALPRYVAHAAGSQKEDHTPYFQAASICLMLSSLSLGFILIMFRHAFAEWLFGDSHRIAFVIALALMLWGLSAQAAVYGYYQGLLAMGRANLLDLCTIAAGPLVVVGALFWMHSVPLMVGAMGCLDLLCSALFAFPILRRGKLLRLPALLGHIKELLRYGIPRVPGDFGAAALTAIGPVVAAHFLGMRQVSDFLLGQAILLVTGYAAGPLEVVLLSKVSTMLGQDRQDDVRRRLEILVTAVLEVSAFVCLQMIIFADVAVGLWVGPTYLGGIRVIRLILLAVPPYLLYMALRSTIDAATVRPLNAGNVLVAISVYVLLIGTSAKFLPARFLLEGIAAALLAVLILLGMLTWRSVRKLYALAIPWGRLLAPLMATLGLGGVAYLCRLLLGFSEHPFQVALLEVGLTCAYVALLTSFGSRWLHYLWRIVFGGRRSWNLAWLGCEVTYEGDY